MSELVAVDKYPAAKFEVEWYCEPPEYNTTFQVVRCSWEMDSGRTIRRIYEWQSKEASEASMVCQRTEPPKR